jgi:hypothetical protein
LDMWFWNVGEFMKAVSTIPEVPDRKSYTDAINEEGRSRSGSTEGWRPKRTDPRILEMRERAGRRASCAGRRSLWEGHAPRESRQDAGSDGVGTQSRRPKCVGRRLSPGLRDVT